MPVISLPDREWIDLVGPLGGVEMVPWDLVSDPPRRDEISFVVPPYMVFQPVAAARPAAWPARGPAAERWLRDSAPRAPGRGEARQRVRRPRCVDAELAVTLALSSLRGIPDFVVAQGRSHWLPAETRSSLADRKVLILGMAASELRLRVASAGSR